MKRLFLIPLMIILVSGLILGGCPQPAPAPAPTPAPSPAPAPAPKPAPAPAPAPAPKPKAEPVVIKVVSAFPVQAAASHGLGTYRDMINERANGELVINWVGGPEVIPPFELAAAVKDGAIDMAMIPPGYCERIHPPSIAFQLWDYPPAELRQNGGYELMVELYKKINTRHIGILNSGNQYRLFSNVPIKDPKTDFKGLKFRTGPDAAVFLDALGIVGVPMQQSEVYTAMQQGVVVGAASVANNIKQFGVYEVCKYWIDPAFWNPIEVGLVNMDRWNTIPANLQALMLDAAKDVEQPEYEWGLAADEAFFTDFRAAGMQPITFSPEDAKWYHSLAYEVRWDTAKKAMTPEDYEKTRALFRE